MKRKITFLLLAVCFLVPAFHLAAAELEGLKALMIDLPGWSADPADGADMSYGGMRAVTASRDYRSGERSFDASILIGTQAASTWMPTYTEGYKMETPEGAVQVSRIGGFLVWEMFEKEGGSGGILVLLVKAAKEADTGAVFAVSFEGMSREEAMKTAQRFNWSRMRDQAGALK
jgi:hypothetical protein